MGIRDKVTSEHISGAIVGAVILGIVLTVSGAIAIGHRASCDYHARMATIRVSAGMLLPPAMPCRCPGVCCESECNCKRKN